MPEEKTKVWFNGIWIPALGNSGMSYYPPGFYEESDRREPELTISAEKLYLLTAALDEHGFLKPRLDERLRTEDLKITHRLMDLLDKVVSK